MGKATIRALLSFRGMGRVRIASLRLSGFKSFPDPVELEFPAPVTAIVGPNGSGKSNIVDAILWVLGEQSPSLLRLKQMGDVVFTGAAGRRPAGSAEVTLTLRSDDGRWRETGGRLVITRRVLRTGPSEYRMNGRSVRLKDVLQELAAVGLGTRAYAIIEQGRVGQVLSARPTDRRVLIEEAAGITGYKLRRHEAELKLEQTRQNLLRIEDIVAEVDRALRKVRRDARQAERYRRLREELTRARRRLRAHELATLRSRRETLRRERARAETEVAAAASALAGAEADLAAARRDADRRRGELEAARSEVSELLAAAERAEAFLERSDDLLEELEGARRRALAEGAAAAERAGELEAELEAARRALAAREGEERAAREALAAREAAAEGARERLAAAEERVASARQELLALVSRITEARNRLREVDRHLDRVAYERTRLERESGQLEGRRREALARLEREREAAAAAEARRGELTARRAEAVAAMEELRAAAAEVDGVLERSGHLLWEARHRLAGVESELERRAARAEEVEGLLPEVRVAGQVGDFLDPEPEAAPLLDRAWGPWLELPVVEADDLASAVAHWPGDEGVRVVLRGRWAPPEAAGSPDGAEPLWPRAGAAPEDAGWLARTLPPAFVVPALQRALELGPRCPEAVLVTPEGVVVQGATVRVPGEGTAAAGVLELRRERERLREEVARLEAEREAAARRREALGRELAELEARAREAAAELVEAEQAHVAAAERERAAEAELSRLERELEAVAAELGRTDAERERLEAQRETLQGEVTRLEERGEAAEAAVDAALAELERLRSAAGEVEVSLEAARAEVRVLAERATAARREAERREADRARALERAEALRREAAAAAERIEATRAEVVATRARLAETHGRLEAARAAARRLEEGLEELAARLERLEREVARRRAAHDAAREALHRWQVEETRLEGERAVLAERVAEELDLALDALEPAELEPEAARTARAEVEALAARVERMRPVNLLALEELGELEERSRFLNEQRDDLKRSVASLERTIREIDATCTERFVETFRQVNEVYAETFTYLFGGGTARLELVDEERPLESGIDIVARPPGKRIQSVQLLSGGEKALAALALLVALFRVRPSPFCILDEVDAPLDDANVERLADLVRAMTEHTQFLLVTHNRRTMARADVLYGVTMERPGISKVVSVRLEEL